MQRRFLSTLLFSIIISFVIVCNCLREDNHPLLPSTGIMGDIDGNTYKTVRIGSQWWMAENLKVTHFRNGDPIPVISHHPDWAVVDSGACCVYENDPGNREIYGLMYNWHAVNDPRGLAPPGWHIPSDEEWKVLEMHLGLSRGEADDVGGRGRMEGGSLKEAGTAHWQPPNAGATNTSGFCALPGGCRYHTNGSYSYLGFLTSFWASNDFDYAFAWARDLNYGYAYIYRTNYEKGAGFSVRCVKDGT